jgi:acetylcholinesterase
MESLSRANPTGATLFAVNDDFFLELPSKLLEEGRFLKVPIIIGTNRNEGTTLLAGIATGSNMPLNTFEDFTALLSDRGIPLAALKKLWDLYGDEIYNPSEARLDLVSPKQSADLGSEFGPRFFMARGRKGCVFQALYESGLGRSGCPQLQLLLRPRPR